MFLLELDLQCRLARHSFDRLEAAVAHRRDGYPEIDRIQALCDCAAFLSATAMISYLLYEGGRNGPTKERCRNLRAILRLGDLELLKNRGARNAFEHFDERIDDHLPNASAAWYRLTIDFSEEEPPANRLTMRWLNTSTLVLTIAGEALDLRRCMGEVDSVIPRIGPVFERMKTEHLVAYDSDVPTRKHKPTAG